MTFIIKIIIAIALMVMIVYVANKLIKSVFNLIAFYDRRNSLDISKQRQGMVFNKKTNKLEADQSVILPFE